MMKRTVERQCIAIIGTCHDAVDYVPIRGCDVSGFRSCMRALLAKKNWMLLPLYPHCMKGLMNPGTNEGVTLTRGLHLLRHSSPRLKFCLFWKNRFLLCALHIHVKEGV